jgi:D-serine deaminase-like pyridoxal phosphate-dependent protein
MEPLLETRKLLADAGLPVTIVSGGGTGTYDVTGNIDGVDEVQCGSYALMDTAYRKIRPEFKVASSVLTTVISVSGSKAVADVGRKGLGCEFGLPLVAGDSEATVTKAAEEHAFIENCDVHVGDKLQLIPSHGCTTHNLYRRMWIARDGIIEDCWPIEGRGCLE